MPLDLKWDRNFALEMAGGDESFLNELLQIMLDSLAVDLEKIIEGIAEGDQQKVVHRIHNIRGSAASLGMKSIRQLAHEGELAAREGDMQRVSDIAKQLVDYLNVVKELVVK